MHPHRAQKVGDQEETWNLCTLNNTTLIVNMKTVPIRNSAILIKNPGSHTGFTKIFN